MSTEIVSTAELEAQIRDLKLKLLIQEHMLSGIKTLAHQLADAFDLTAPQRGFRLNKIKMQPRPNHLITETMETAIVEEFRSGVTVQKLANKFGLHETTVRTRLIKLGEHVPSNRLDQNTIRIFGEMWDAGNSVRQIANQHHVSLATVSTHLERLGKRKRQILKLVNPENAGVKARASQNRKLRTL